MNRLRYIYLKLPLLNRHRYVNQETPLLNRHRQVNLKLRYMIASTPLHPITLHHTTQHRTTPQPVPHPAPHPITLHRTAPYHAVPYSRVALPVGAWGLPPWESVAFSPALPPLIFLFFLGFHGEASACKVFTKRWVAHLMWFLGLLLFWSIVVACVVACLPLALEVLGFANLRSFDKFHILTPHRTTTHRTAPHCTILRSTALHRTLHRTLHRNLSRCTARHPIMLHRTAPYRAAPYPVAPNAAPHHAPHPIAPHRTALHRTAPHRTAQHRTAPHLTVVQCSAVHNADTFHDVTLQRTTMHRTAPHCTLLRCTALKPIMLHHITQHHTATHALLHPATNPIMLHLSRCTAVSVGPQIFFVNCAPPNKLTRNSPY